MFGSEKYRIWNRHPGYNGGGKGGSGTQTQKSEPWSGVQPYLKSGYATGQDLYMNNSPDYYPGQTYANTDPLQTEARTGLEQYARGQMGQDVNGLRQGFGTLMGAADVNNNPYLYQAAMGATRPIVDQLTEQILPSIRSGATNTGQYGGSRQALAEGTAIGKATQAMGDMTSGMYSNAYQSGLGTLSNALGMAPQQMQMWQSPYSTLDTLGGQYQADQQKQIDAATKKWDYNEQLPYSQLSDWMNILNAGGGLGGTSKTSSSGGGSDAMGAVGAVASIAAAFI
jgi:hypothetical protein